MYNSISNLVLDLDLVYDSPKKVLDKYSKGGFGLTR